MACYSPVKEPMRDISVSQNTVKLVSTLQRIRQSPVIIFRLNQKTSAMVVLL